MVYHGRNTSYNNSIMIARILSLLVFCALLSSPLDIFSFRCCRVVHYNLLFPMRHMCVTSPHVTECDMVVTSSHVKCSFARKQTWGIRWPLWRLKLRLPLICEEKWQNISINQMHIFSLFVQECKKITKIILWHTL